MFVGQLSREKRQRSQPSNQRRKLRQDDDYVALGDGISRCDPMANWQDDKFSAARRIHLVGASRRSRGNPRGPRAPQPKPHNPSPWDNRRQKPPGNDNVSLYKPAARMSADSATRSACKCKEVPIRYCREAYHTILSFCFDCKYQNDYCMDRLASPIAELGRAGAHPTTYERTNPEE